MGKRMKGCWPAETDKARKYCTESRSAWLAEVVPAGS